MRLRICIRGRVRPSVRPSACLCVSLYYFRTTNMVVFEGEKSSKDIVINDVMSDDEEVASNVPRGTCFKVDYIFVR